MAINAAGFGSILYTIGTAKTLARVGIQLQIDKQYTTKRYIILKCNECQIETTICESTAIN